MVDELASVGECILQQAMKGVISWRTETTTPFLMTVVAFTAKSPRFVGATLAYVVLERLKINLDSFGTTNGKHIRTPILIRKALRTSTGPNAYTARCRNPFFARQLILHLFHCEFFCIFVIVKHSLIFTTTRVVELVVNPKIDLILRPGRWCECW